MESSDARLVDGLRRGTPAAFAGLHERYATGIYNLALRVVRHGPDAEDITQDVLIRAFERLPRDREVRLRPWLYRLTLNRCYDYLRGTARRPLPVAMGADLPSPQDPYDQSELQRLLEAAIGDLTRRQRAALLLKDVHGLSLVEVAACLDLTPGSVEVLLARARRSFRARYEERCLVAGRPSPRSAGGLLALPLLPLPAAMASRRRSAAARGAGSRAAGRRAVPAAHGGRRERHRRRARPARVGQDRRADRRCGGDHGHSRDRRYAGRPPSAATGRRRRRGRGEVPGDAAPVAPTRSPRARATASPSLASPPPSPAATTQPSPAPTEVAGPLPQESPLGITTPTPEPSVTPTPVDTPTAHATTTPPATPSPDPSPSPSPSPSPAPSASPCPSPAAP